MHTGVSLRRGRGSKGAGLGSAAEGIDGRALSAHGTRPTKIRHDCVSVVFLRNNRQSCRGSRSSRKLAAS